MNSWKSLKEIVEEADVANNIDKYTKELNRFVESYDALKWLLAHKGQSIANFKIIEGVKYYLYAQAADEVAGTPRIVVLYTCDDNAIYIEGIDAHL